MRLSRQSIYLRSTDHEIGWKEKFKVTGVQEVDFGEDYPKIQLILENREKKNVMFVLNYTNTQYLSNKGIEDSEQLMGKSIVLEKTERVIESKNKGKNKTMGIWITDIQ